MNRNGKNIGFKNNENLRLAGWLAGWLPSTSSFITRIQNLLLFESRCGVPVECLVLREEEDEEEDDDDDDGEFVELFSELRNSPGGNLAAEQLNFFKLFYAEDSSCSAKIDRHKALSRDRLANGLSPTRPRCRPAKNLPRTGSLTLIRKKNMHFIEHMREYALPFW